MSKEQCAGQNKTGAVDGKEGAAKTGIWLAAPLLKASGKFGDKMSLGIYSEAYLICLLVRP